MVAPFIFTFTVGFLLVPTPFFTKNDIGDFAYTIIQALEEC
jgi:hypothetical protein